MDGWSKISSSLANLNLGEKAGSLTKGFGSTVQATRERLGQVDPQDLTELPPEYRDLEARVDALRQAHLNILKITKVYESESYDYPTQIQESLSEFGTSISTNVTNFAATNLKGTSLPAPAPAAAAPVLHKTLPHALSRVALTSSQQLGADERLGKALSVYGSTYDKIADVRLTTQATIQNRFLQPWQLTLSSSIAVAMKARAAVKASRLELDARKFALKSANPTRQEQVRLEVENAEDDLVQKTEVAISLMKAVLENPEPLKNLNDLAKAQLEYHAAAAEALAGMQGDIEELATAAEGEYRKSRDH